MHKWNLRIGSHRKRQFLFSTDVVSKATPLNFWGPRASCVKPSKSGRVMTPPRECLVVPFAGFQLAYQGFPWQPALGYELGSPLEGRRYPNGETYPAWHEIDDMIASMPPGTRLSFHLNESQTCPYVSSLLQGLEEALRLVDVLCNKYSARHIQININARGVPPQLFTTPGAESEKSATQIASLASQYPNTLFLIAVFQKKGGCFSK